LNKDKGWLNKGKERIKIRKRNKVEEERE